MAVEVEKAVGAAVETAAAPTSTAKDEPSIEGGTTFDCAICRDGAMLADGIPCDACGTIVMTIDGVRHVTKKQE